jgi:hypothetical protein
MKQTTERQLRFKLGFISMLAGIFLTSALTFSLAGPTDGVGPSGNSAFLKQFLTKTLADYNNNQLPATNLQNTSGVFKSAQSLVDDNQASIINKSTKGYTVGTNEDVAVQLNIGGGMQIGTVTAECSPDLAGTLRYQNGTIQLCAESSWQDTCIR